MGVVLWTIFGEYLEWIRNQDWTLFGVEDGLRNSDFTKENMVSRGLGRRNEDLVKKNGICMFCFFFLQFVKCGILPSEWLQQSGWKKLGSEWSGKSPTKTALNEVWEFEISGLNSQDCLGLVWFPHCLTGLIHLGLVWSRFHLNGFLSTWGITVYSGP